MSTHASNSCSKQDLKDRFEMSCNLLVGVIEDAHLEGMMAVIRSYRDFLKENVERAGPLPPQTFVSWMESAERDPDGFPEPWGAHLVELFDAIVIGAVRDDNVQPATVVAALDEWTEETTADVTQIHDLPEGFFDV